jgi:hypothetical protein
MDRSGGYRAFSIAVRVRDLSQFIRFILKNTMKKKIEKGRQVSRERQRVSPSLASTTKSHRASIGARDLPYDCFRAKTNKLTDNQTYIFFNNSTGAWRMNNNYLF